MMKIKIGCLVAGIVLLIAVVFTPSSAPFIAPLEANEKDQHARGWYYVREIKDDFETSSAFLKSSIEEEGLSISYVGHVAKMMARTSSAVEGAALIYKEAMIYQFCSASLGFKLFALDPHNIAACPLGVFIYELKAKPGVVYLGYRLPPGLSDKASVGASRLVFEETNAVLKRIISRAAE